VACSASEYVGTERQDGAHIMMMAFLSVRGEFCERSRNGVYRWLGVLAGLLFMYRT
jgi:hypothetical protein